MALYDRHGSADRLFLDGEWIKGGGGSREVVNPSDGGTLGSTGIADTEDVDRAVQAGRAAQLSWAEVPFDDRAKGAAEGGSASRGKRRGVRRLADARGGLGARQGRL